MATPSRILVVDDDPAVRRLLYEIVFGIGHAVVLCEDGAATDVMLQKQEFDLVITDQNLPGMTGMEIIRKLRARGVMTPVILISTSLQGQGLEGFTDLAPITFLDKPFGVETIRDAITKLLPKSDD